MNTIIKNVFLAILFLMPGWVFSQPAGVAGLSDGVSIYYYASIHEAVAAANKLAYDKSTAHKSAFDNPFEIMVFNDIVLDEPIIIDNDIHIRLLPLGDIYLSRGEDNTSSPLIWIKGENSSLTLGKPEKEGQLIIDGSYPLIEAEAPLVSVNGMNSKLIMYDKVTIQNNMNNFDTTNKKFNQSGAGVLIFTYSENLLSNDEHLFNRQAEFIMKGGTIQGNINTENSVIACGGGVIIVGYGVFTMDGGAIMNNIAQINGGGFFAQGYGSFRKTGGIIYGADAPEDYRNFAIEGYGTPLSYGHAVYIAKYHTDLLRARDTTVWENDFLNYTGTPYGEGIFGEGENWDNPPSMYRRFLIMICVFILVLGLFVIITIKISIGKRKNAASEEKGKPNIDFDNLNLTSREEEIFKLLFTELSMKQIASTLKISYSGVNFHANNIYRKVGIQGRTELFVKFRIKAEE